MKAVTVHQYGPPSQLTLDELPIPRAGDGQIQVRIAAASINPLDLRLPRGDFPQLPVTFPHVPGNDFAGTVTAIGDGVTGFQVGEEVFGHAVPAAWARWPARNDRRSPPARSPSTPSSRPTPR